MASAPNIVKSNNCVKSVGNGRKKLSDLKQELSTDVHIVQIEELLSRLNTNSDKGLTQVHNCCLVVMYEYMYIETN